MARDTNIQSAEAEIFEINGLAVQAASGMGTAISRERSEPALGIFAAKQRKL